MYYVIYNQTKAIKLLEKHEDLSLSWRCKYLNFAIKHSYKKVKILGYSTGPCWPIRKGMIEDDNRLQRLERSNIIFLFRVLGGLPCPRSASTVFTHIHTSECCFKFSKMEDFDKREDGLIDIWTSLATSAISFDISIALGPAPITTTFCKRTPFINP